MSPERHAEKPVEQNAPGQSTGVGESPSHLSLGPPTSRTAVVNRRKRWRKVIRIVERGHVKRPEPRPRRGAGYRGRLGKLLRELRVLHYQNGGVAACSSKGVSGKTRSDRRHVMKSMLIEMYRGKYQLWHLANFRSKHALDILQRWTERGLASSTMATYVSHLRTLVTWLRKGELLAVIDRYCDEHPGLTRRQAAADRDKSEHGAGVSFREIYRRATETGNEHFVCQLLLIAAFGLRAREAWAWRPHLSIDLMGCVNVDWGTKGGRPRRLPAPLGPMQREAVERAQKLVPDRHGSMIPVEYASMKEWSGEFYRLCKRIGLTRAQLGATAHSLRHGVLIELYEGTSGETAPVRGGMDPPASPARERAARTFVAEVAGHSRSQVSSAYLGSRRRKRGPSAASSTAQDACGTAPGIDTDQRHLAGTTDNHAPADAGETL